MEVGGSVSVPDLPLSQVVSGPGNRSMANVPLGLRGRGMITIPGGSASWWPEHGRRGSGSRRPGYDHCPWGWGGQGLGIATLCRGLWDMTTESVASLAGFRWDKSEATC